jgi:hypothetical protein
MENKLIITEPDRFVFVDITEQAEAIFNNTTLDLYAWDGNSEQFMDSIYNIRKSIERGSRIVIEGGHLAAKREVNWLGADKVLINGYWYGKYADILRG